MSTNYRRNFALSAKQTLCISGKRKRTVLIRQASGQHGPSFFMLRLGLQSQVAFELRQFILYRRAALGSVFLLQFFGLIDWC